MAVQETTAAASSSVQVSKPVEEIKSVDEFQVVLKRKLGFFVKARAVQRLYLLYQLIHGGNKAIKTYKRNSDEGGNCALGFQTLVVNQPAFNQQVRELVRSEVWLLHSIPGTDKLPNPTRPVYELLRQIGVHPFKHCRGPKEHDPNARDFMYATQYGFNKHTLLLNQHRLQVYVFSTLCNCAAWACAGVLLPRCVGERDCQRQA